MSANVDAGFQPMTVQLRDGRLVTLRAVRAQDADRLQAAIRGLSAESRHFRFFSAMKELTPALLDRATHPDATRELQLVAVAGTADQEEIIGGARYAAVAIDGDCEFAVAVVDAWQGLGLARSMLETLIRVAGDRGFARMEGYILASNVAMLLLAARLGFARTESPEGPSICLVRRDLGTDA